MKYSFFFLMFCALFFHADLFAMKKSGAVLSHSAWPPLLWITRQSNRIFAQDLHQHKISVATFIKGQLESARKDTFALIGQTAGLTQDDIEKIRAFTAQVKEYDARAAQRSFLYRKDDYQEEMQDYFHGIQKLINTFKVEPDFNIFYDSQFHLDTHYHRSIKDIIFTVDDTLVLAHPENNEYVARPELIIGPLFFQFNLDEQWGSLARQVAGHIALEHATERYLLKEVMKKRKVLSDVVKAALVTLHQLHELEADLIPASHNADFAHYVLCWLNLQKRVASAPCVKERILNVKTLIDLHVECEALENKKY